MAEFKISRIRYTWKGTWSTATTYNKDDVVNFGGGSWVCIRQHTSSAFNDDLTFIPEGDTITQPAWIKMTDGYQWRDAWESGTLYSPGDIVLFGGVVYLAVQSHTASNLNDDISNWTIYAVSSKWNNTWEASYTYGQYDIVRYNGTVYRCLVGHTSNSNFEDDQSKWQIVYSGIEYRGTWLVSTRYAVNDLVKYGGSLYRCNTGHTSSNTFDDSVWSIEFLGNEFGGEWSADTVYQKGDVVRHGGYLYYSKLNHQGQNPGEVTLGVNTYWAILSKAVNSRGEWSKSQTYKTGDLVRNGGVLYVAIQDTLSDESTLSYLDSGNWEIVVPGSEWKNYWEEEFEYAVGDVVLFDGSAYRCTFGHIADSFNFPGDNGEGFNYWTVILQASERTALTSKGDLISFGLSRYRQDDGSTFGATDVPIGNSEELLVVGNDSEVEYKRWGNKQRFFYVAPHGIDDDEDPNAGINIFKPYRTVRYACERADDGFEGTTTVYAQAGTYEEVLPIIVPARTAIRGHEERTTTIKPNPAGYISSEDLPITLSAINRILSLIAIIVAGNTVEKTAGNNLDQVTVFDEIEETDEDGNIIIQQVPVTGSSEGLEQIQTLAGVFVEYVNFYLNNGDSLPEMSGTNTATTDQGILNTIRILSANRLFLAQEAVSYTLTENPAYDLDQSQFKLNIKKYIDAWIYDILYPGTYKTIYEGKHYKNAVLGSKTDDMFYCRDASGIRHLTIEGLEGIINPPGVFDLFQRPTGGTFVSLDPGWGPDDERCWIVNRSPYIQGLATFGYAAYGQVIDGSLHNGGNKSIVSNDFTQVISDGVGAYVLNNGRAELVSVFTYYAQVGYLAEQGGIIRATNGNCSYGNYGAYATGVDPTETPRSAVVDNRNQDATVVQAFAGEVNDEILILEYGNAGQGYTQATTTFLGSGVNAEVVNDEFRDDGVFDVRLINPLDSGVPGGGGFTQVGNNAQAGDELTITLATNDTSEEAELLGLRVIITSGTGTGQYGYVQAYDSTSKVLTVYRESDNQPGWDHVIPGTPSALILDTSSTYRLEPRPIFSDPGFAAEAINLQAQTEWNKVAYGETTDTFTDVISELGTGTVETQDGLSALAATFDITRTKRDYLVTINNAGAGYAVGDELTISGTDLGGESPDNDITITVTGISDDSTNSITSFVFEGKGRSGLFVVTPSVGRTLSYSANGEDWTVVGTGLPSAGDWKCLTAGNGHFVAIRNNSSASAYSLNGINWVSSSMPASRQWNDVAFGDGVFFAVAGDSNSGAISTDSGLTWSLNNLPSFGDSTLNEWVSIAYGKNKFVAIANSNNIAAIGEYNPETELVDWTGTIMDVIDDSSSKDWVEVTYGNGRFIALSRTGDLAYSFDGSFWYPETMPSPDGSTVMSWNSINYGQGVFLAVCDTGDADVFGDETTGPTTYCATSYDGIVWENRALASEREWTHCAFGNPDVTLGDSTPQDNTGMWIAINRGITDIANRIFTGARTLGRAIIVSGRVSQIRIWEPGSGYSTSPTLTLIDPNNTSELFVDARLGESVLGQPSWINRGQGYRSSSTTVTITGDGFADIIGIGDEITLDQLEVYPGPGTQIVFDGISQIYTIITVTELGQNANGTFKARFRIDPRFDVNENEVVLHGDSCILRERYSQCRITNHDFLDIGTGNFVDTNYPELYSTGLYIGRPENEVTETDGGRVFYSSTDQDGNFRVGELFAVEQATGIVTISADFFDLDGLSELRLGGIRVGGSGVVIREFSTDPLFTEDSNNVIPTQRAIGAFLQNRLSVGGSELTTASFIAGTVKVGADEIRSTIGGTVQFDSRTNFEAGGELLENDDGTSNGQVQGSILAQSVYFRSFSDDPLRTS